MTWLPLRNICRTNENDYVPFDVITYRSFSNVLLVSVFVARVTRRVPLVEQELFTLLKHLCFLPVFNVVPLLIS